MLLGVGFLISLFLFTNAVPAPELVAEAPDRLTREILAIIDHNVSPCVDFHLHKCPVNAEKIPSLWAIYEVERLIKEEVIGNEKDTLVPFDLKNVMADIQTRCFASVDCYKGVYSVLRGAVSVESSVEEFEKDLWPMILSGEDGEQIQALMKAIMHSAIEIASTNDSARDAVAIYQSLKGRLAVMDNLLQNISNKDVYARMVDNIRDEIEQTFKLTPYLVTSVIPSSTKGGKEKRWLDVILELLHKVKGYVTFGDQDIDSTFIKRIIGNYEADYYQAGEKLPGTSTWHFLVRHGYAVSQLMKLPTGLHEELRTFKPSRIAGTNHYDSFSVHASVSIATIGSPVSVIYGLFGALCGHTFFHSFGESKKPNQRLVLPFNTSPVYAQADRCLTTANSELAKELGEGYHHGHLKEELVDLEGMRVAFNLLKKHLGDDLHKPAYPGVKHSHAELFFYSTMLPLCNHKNAQGRPKSTRPEIITHYSSIHLRTNSAVRQLPEFQETFHCKDTDPMVIPENQRCYFYGPKTSRYNESAALE